MARHVPVHRSAHNHAHASQSVHRHHSFRVSMAPDSLFKECLNSLVMLTGFSVSLAFWLVFCMCFFGYWPSFLLAWFWILLCIIAQHQLLISYCIVRSLLTLASSVTLLLPLDLLYTTAKCLLAPACLGEDPVVEFHVSSFHLLYLLMSPVNSPILNPLIFL